MQILECLMRNGTKTYVVFESNPCRQTELGPAKSVEDAILQFIAKHPRKRVAKLLKESLKEDSDEA